MSNHTRSLQILISLCMYSNAKKINSFKRLNIRRVVRNQMNKNYFCKAQEHDLHYCYHLLSFYTQLCLLFFDEQIHGNLQLNFLHIPFILFDWRIFPQFTSCPSWHLLVMCVLLWELTVAKNTRIAQPAHPQSSIDRRDEVIEVVLSAWLMMASVFYQ